MFSNLTASIGNTHCLKNSKRERFSFRWGRLVTAINVTAQANTFFQSAANTRKKKVKCTKNYYQKKRETEKMCNCNEKIHPPQRNLLLLKI